MFPASSSSYMDQEVVEISPPLTWSSKSRLLKQKEVKIDSLESGYMYILFDRSYTFD